MTAKISFTQAAVRRAISAARKEGLYVLAIRADGSVVVGETPIKISEGGLSPIGARLLGFDAPCQCGHDEGAHGADGRCAVLDCACRRFATA